MFEFILGALDRIIKISTWGCMGYAHGGLEWIQTVIIFNSKALGLVPPEVRSSKNSHSTASNRNQNTMSTEIRPEVEMQFRRKAEVVVFDKDGTLIDFHSMWVKWAHDLLDSLDILNVVNPDQILKFASAIGFDRSSSKVDKRSPICCSPMCKIEAICLQSLEESMSRDEAKSAMANIWKMPNPLETAKPLTDLPVLFNLIKNDLGMKIAVCTTDNLDITLKTLELLKVLHMVDYVVGGDDPTLAPKPSPEQIRHICSKLGVCPTKSIMVGDTITDMRMGRAAGVYLNIGIRNGAGTVSDLSEHADFILPSMNNLGGILHKFA